MNIRPDISKPKAATAKSAGNNGVNTFGYSVTKPNLLRIINKDAYPVKLITPGSV